MITKKKLTQIFGESVFLRKQKLKTAEKVGFSRRNLAQRWISNGSLQNLLAEMQIAEFHWVKN